MSKKIYLSPESRPTPHGKYAVGGVYEHDVCNDIADLLKPVLEGNGFLVTIAPRTWSMVKRVNYANANGYDYYMPIHTNGGGGTGAECLYFNHPDSIRANQLVYDELTKLYPSKRGIKDFSHFFENNTTRMVSCYPEIAFHDNSKDARYILDNKQDIAQALNDGVCAYFKVTPEKPTLPPKPNEEQWGVMKQVIVLTGKQKAQKHADELNAKAGKDEYYKILKVK